MTSWQYYPRSEKPPQLALQVVQVFEEALEQIDSSQYALKSNEVLAQLANQLEGIGFEVERGKKANERIRVPVLFGLNGKPEKTFDADAYHEEGQFVLEVEAGRAVANNQFLKDLFQACMMHNVNYLGIAVRKIYVSGKVKSKDFERIVTFFDTLYASNRLSLPLKGILILGY